MSLQGGGGGGGKGVEIISQGKALQTLSCLHLILHLPNSWEE